MTPSGVVTSYRLPGAIALPVAVTLGSDGNVWFVDAFQNVAGKITPSGAISEYPLPANSGINAIANGPDGNIWLTDGYNNALIKMSTSGSVLASYPVPTADAQPWGITAGPDGNVWFTEEQTGKIGRMTTSGAVTEFPTPSGADSTPVTIVAGPDGRMWYAEMGPEAGFGKIGYITTDGQQARDFIGNGYHVHALAFDSSGKLWATELQLPEGGNKIGVFAY
jgi:virginiamycin B lyase